MITTKILPDSVLNHLKKHLWLYVTLKSSVIFLRSFLPRLSYEGLPGRVHPNDFMLINYSENGLSEYTKQSKIQFGIIEESLKLASKNWSSECQFLDLGCGYGRILRWATTKLPPKNITASDVIPAAIKFCAKEFAVKTALTDGELSAENFQKYDVIFSCSVLTHLSPARIDKYIELLNQIAKPNAIIIFSLHGEASLDYSKQINKYLDKSYTEEEIKTKGVCFYPYEHYRDKELGDTFFSVDYFQQKLSELAPEIKILKHFKGPCYEWQHDWLVLQRC